jgi:hypothetical protein
MMKDNSKCKQYLPSTEDCPHCHSVMGSENMLLPRFRLFQDPRMKSDMLEVILEKHGYYQVLRWLTNEKNLKLSCVFSRQNPL